MRKKLVKWGGVSFLFLLVLWLLWGIFKDISFSLLYENILKVNKWYLLLGVLVMLFFSCSEAINIRIVLKELGYNLSFFKYFKYAIVGFFFSSITPSSSGGQPMQIYYMNKDKVEVSHSFISLMVELFSFQVASFFWAIVGFVVMRKELFSLLGNFKYLFYCGFLINLLLLVFLFVLLFSRKLFLKIVDFVFKLMDIFHYKKKDVFYEKAIEHVNKYNESATFLKNNKVILIKTMGIALLKIFLYHSIPYFVYLSFGLSEYSWWQFVFVESVLYCVVSFLPFPGAMGVSEGGFMLLFKMFFSESILASAMLLSRTISLYFYLCLVGIILFWLWVRDIVRKKYHNL